MKTIFNNIYWLLCIVCTYSLTVSAQELAMHRIAQNDGSDFNYVNDITQDADGFMWFATNKGLFKYDGNQLYQINNGSSNTKEQGVIGIKSVFADADGIIWVGTIRDGLNRYNSKTGEFTHYGHKANDPSSIADNRIHDILRDSRGKLWIATTNGLDQFDPKTNGFIHFQPKEGDTTSLSEMRVTCLYEDKQGTLWVGTGSRWQINGRHAPEFGGLNRYNHENNTFTQYRSKPSDPNSLKSNKITSVFEDNNGTLWITTHMNGLYQMNRKKGTFKQMNYDPTHPKIFGNPSTGFKNESVNFISQDTLGGYWIGKNNGGLFYFNASKGEMINTNEVNGGTGAIAAAKVAYTSRDGVFWVGSAREGYVFYTSLLSKNIPSPFVSSEMVNVLYEEQDGTFWIGKDNDLLRVDAHKGDTLTFNTELNFLPDSANTVFCIEKDRNGDLWVGASTGLFKWDTTNQTFTVHRQNPNNQEFLDINKVSTILEDSRQNFWVGTLDGLYILERSSGTFTHIEKSEKYAITDLLEDKTGNVWITVYHPKSGINRYNPLTKKNKTYQAAYSFWFIYQDSDSVIWAGGPDGIFTYNPERDNFFPLDKSHALSGFRYPLKMEEDDQNNLWITTRNGIVKFNPERSETSVYSHNFGVIPNFLSFWDIHKGMNGDLFIGNRKGYYQIDPGNFPSSAIASKVFFTRLLLFNQEIHPSSKGPLKKPLQHTKTIKLRSYQNVFTIDFSIIDYHHQEDVRMLYYLENYDNDWITANASKRASYFDVKPGSYVLHVKGCNSDGVWDENKIELIILPPWYRSWPAFVMYGLLVVVGLFAFDRLQRRRIIKIERQKNQERELAQAKEIEKAYTELKSTQSQLIQSEKMASLGELTAGIAHEIQNPLNFVNNFSEVNKEMLVEMNEEIDNGNLDEVKEIARDIIANEQKINHHGKRAESIVKGMLQHSRTSSGQKERTDINALADEYLRLSYHGLRAKDKSFNADFKMETDEKLPKLNVVPQDMGRVLLNLINNAFYAVNEKTHQEGTDYKPLVEVITKTQGSTVEIKVKDNGNGMPESIKDKIFQPFFTTKPTGSGTGLGLSLSYDIVKAHGGELKVETKEEEGTEFIINIPTNG